MLLQAGANIRKRTEWWSGGFGVLDECDPSLVEFLLERGAVVDAHSASRLVWMPKLRELVTADPSAVHARGGDGQTPLHFASTVEVAEFLLANGADIDARDLDHESTPAQYMLRVDQKRHYPRDRQDVARYLVVTRMPDGYSDGGGARRYGPGAAASGPRPRCIRMSVSEEWFPEAGSARGRHHLHLDSGPPSHGAHRGARFRPRGCFPVAVGADAGGSEAIAGV